MSHWKFLSKNACFISFVDPKNTVNQQINSTKKPPEFVQHPQGHATNSAKKPPEFVQHPQGHATNSTKNPPEFVQHPQGHATNSTKKPPEFVQHPKGQQILVTMYAIYGSITTMES